MTTAEATPHDRAQPARVAAAASSAPTASADFATAEDARRRYLRQDPRAGRPTAAAVMTSFNKREDVRKNLDAIRAQTVKFDQIVVVDNASRDGTAAMIRAEYPEVLLVETPDSSYGACETFNLGFATADAEFLAILDDDVVLPPDWLARMLAKFATEPPSTALISSHVDEPGTPDWYHRDPEVVRERYMATFRGCATLARKAVIAECGYYDPDFFIYGNERDLASRVIASGRRVLQYPSVVVKHGTPFGMKAGKRSLYYHVRNLWWYLFKHVPWPDVAKFLFQQTAGKAFRGGKKPAADAVGTIGVFKTIRETPGGAWVVVKATLDAWLGLPKMLKKRRPVRAPDFTLPSH
jgi:GT2 family glycosyltransferase